MDNPAYEIFKQANSLGENNNQSTDIEKEILAHLMTLESVAMAKWDVKARQYNEILEMNREQIESELK